MGTNFYQGNKHIGKRSAAGFYCWDCKVTLCAQGDSKVHYDESSWYLECPKCGKKPIAEAIDHSAAGRELGFNTGKPLVKTGVASCSSFSWAMDQSALKPGIKIRDEYGVYYTMAEFKQILDECPIQLYGSIGMDFS